MKEIMEFLTNAGVFYLATTDGDKPHLRPMGFLMEWEGKLAMCTSNEKEMYKQLKANPNLELSAVNADSVTLRVCGKAVFVTNEANQKKALEIMPTLGAIYAVGDGKFEIFVVDGLQAHTQTMTGEKKVLA